MSERFPWAEGLRISSAQIDEWTPLAAGQSLLKWCIENNKVDEDNYLAWAVKHYRMPHLKNSYFDQPWPTQLAEKYWDQLPESALAIGEWEDLVFIGCPEPQEGIKLERPHQLVLISWLKLQQLRDLIKQTKASSNLSSDTLLKLAFQHIGILSLEFHVDKLSRPLL